MKYFSSFVRHDAYRCQSTVPIGMAAIGFVVGTRELALNAAPNTTGCPPGVQHTETEAGGVGSVDNVTRKAEAEGGGVGSANNATHKAEAEAGGMGSQRSTSATPCVR